MGPFAARAEQPRAPTALRIRVQRAVAAIAITLAASGCLSAPVYQGAVSDHFDGQPFGEGRDFGPDGPSATSVCVRLP